ncbi:MAG: alpha/beta hydrolase [Deltaproteobacteria bacterium]|nr:alpha/beta hydrolase [Deltaproteobacteria bacterium]
MKGLYHYGKGDPGKPTVLCLHGLLGSARNLHRLVEAIAAAGFHVVAFDQRGHGHSPHAADYELSSLAADVFELMDELSVDRAHLVGHSMGARVSLAAAAADPARVTSLAMLDSGVNVRLEHLKSLQEIVAPLPDGYASRAEAEAALKHHSTVFRQFLVTNLRAQPEPPFALRWIFDLKGIREELLRTIQADQANAFRALRCPTLVARGELSESLLDEDLEELKRLNPRVQTAVIPDAGHWVHVDNFTATAEVVTRFLRST